MISPFASQPRRWFRTGFTMVEATISTVIVSVMLVGALQGVAACNVMRSRVADRARAQQLGMDLLAEALQQTYAPPATPDPTGPTRAGWTCVDDYNGFTESPPLTEAGNAIPDASAWTRSVTVTGIDPVALTPTAASNTGVKRITVTVSRGSFILATVAGYRTLGWVEAIPSPTDATGNHPPTAVAAVSNVTRHIGETATFDGSGSSDRDGNTLSYVWNFGDGTSSTGVSATHAYSALGTYTATLTIYDGYGGVGISSVTITVTN